MISGSAFLDNSASNNGGAIQNMYSSITIEGCRFSGNHAYSGGAVANRDFVGTTIRSCAFVGNVAARSGGVLDDALSSISAPASLINCTFLGNHATKSGGGLYSSDAWPIVQNCAFSGNVADVYGGGAYNDSSAKPVFQNCDFVGNVAALAGGGVANYFAWATLSNCILWGNISPSGAQLYEHGFSDTFTIASCDVADGWAGSAVLDADPRFVRIPDPGIDGLWGTSDDDYGNLRLQTDSPCIDAGDNSLVSTQTPDLDENTRVVDFPAANDPGAIVDIGAYERQLPLAVLSGRFDADGEVPSVVFTFNNVLDTATLSSSDLIVRDSSTGRIVPPDRAQFDPATRTLTFALPRSIADANYRATLSAASIVDRYGSTVPGEVSLDFFTLGGDANRNRVVDVNDLGILALNWQAHGAIFTQGDFNYDGVVDVTDLGHSRDQLAEDIA